MNILVLGSGAREHAMVFALAKSPSVHKIYASPGNAGMTCTAICKRVPFRDNIELIRYFKDKVELAVVGSSKFVEDGTVDALVLAGIPVIGPAEDAGKIETSKAFATKFIVKHKIPSPASRIVVNEDEIDQAFQENPLFRVIKCDGFSKGTGVAITDSHAEALAAARKFLSLHGAPIILQEKVDGVECSYTILTDGQQWVSFSSCRDYKRVEDGESGLTTGGMGAVSPSPDLTPELDKQIVETIVQPVVDGMKADGLMYRGFMSIQLMLTSKGPMVLEFNARPGDPETQSILMRFRGDLAGLLKDCAMGCLTSVGSEVAFGKHAAVSVVIARAGYPDNEHASPRVGGIEKIADSLVFYSSCRRSDDSEDHIFKSGRLISVTGIGETLEEAREKVYQDISRLELENVRFRRDIGQT